MYREWGGIYREWDGRESGVENNAGLRGRGVGICSQ